MKGCTGKHLVLALTENSYGLVLDTLRGHNMSVKVLDNPAQKTTFYM